MSRTVFITGASSGFGAAAARKFAAQGDRLILAARREDKLTALSAELAGQTELLPVILDVRNRSAVEAAVAALPEPFRDVDILINNAGLALGLEPAYEADMDDWETMIDTNIKGLVWATRLLLPGMVERNRGQIVNIGSTAGAWPYPGGNVYGGTKAFVEQFSRNLRADLLGKNIRVTCLAPGMAKTEFSQVRFKGDNEKAATVYDSTTPLSAEDIADIIVWLTSIPPHVNVNFLEVMSICQSWGHLAVHRQHD